MGGCCSSSTGADKDRTPVYYYCPQTLEEHKPVSFTNVTASAVSPELFYDTNMDLSVPGAHQAPSAPVLCDVDLAISLTPPEKFGHCTGHMQLMGSGSVAEADVEDENLKDSDIKNEIISPGSVAEADMEDENLKDSDCKNEIISPGSVAEADVEDENSKDSDCKNEIISQNDTLGPVKDEPSKLTEPDVLATEEEDVCPTCLEEYDAENPRIITNCEHHFHLSCIFEWMERSETCPICDQIMIFETGSGEE